MTFKFPIDEAVEYKPLGRAVGLFKVIRHMPHEDRESASRYVIKSLREGFERIVQEFELEPADIDESKYVNAEASPRRRP